MKKLFKFFKSFYFVPTMTLLLYIAILIAVLAWGINWIVSAAYADSMRYGYCLVDDASLWQKVDVIKINKGE